MHCVPAGEGQHKVSDSDRLFPLLYWLIWAGSAICGGANVRRAQGQVRLRSEGTFDRRFGDLARVCSLSPFDGVLLVANCRQPWVFRSIEHLVGEVHKFSAASGA